MDPLLLAALGAGAYYFLVHKKQPSHAFQPVTGGVTNKPWLTRVMNVTGSGDNKRTTVELWAPAGSWGPHLQLHVATYDQTGSDKASRVATYVNETAPKEIIKAAGQDFGIKKGGAVISGRRLHMV
jgi:hypothetical protein